jgi:predicted O-methyltransferase YrrM
VSDDHAIDRDTASAYVTGLFAPEDALLAELREELRRQDMPLINVSAEEGRLLQVLLTSIGARRVLEIGTLGGYSAIWMARALPPDGQLISLELREKHARVAREFVRRAALHHIIDIRVAPALETLADLQRDERQFDACFIDADKENYPAYLDYAVRLVRPGGLILGDNTFRRNRVFDPNDQDLSITAVREFNERIAQHPKLFSTIIPLRDGLSISVVRAQARPSNA